jgi:hypothetical protein
MYIFIGVLVKLLLLFFIFLTKNQIIGNDKFDFKGILADEMLLLNSMDITAAFSKVVQKVELCAHIIIAQ